MASSKMFVTMICITLISLVAVGCSDDSNPTTTTPPVDTAPPAVPANVDVAYDLSSGSATISWAPNTTDSDLAGYVVSRDSYGDVANLVATPTLINSYQDTNPPMGTSTYSVYAVDQSGNQSAVVTAQLVRTASHQSHDLVQQ